MLDTDGVNAFAAPGGFIHITRGALALIKNEAELADVLAHEIAHVTEKHTLSAISKSKLVGVAADASRSQVIGAVTERAYAAVLENYFDRGEEAEADKVGVTLANKAGYAPTGLAAFLTRLTDRNKDLKERSGMFASHPEAKSRLDALRQDHRRGEAHGRRTRRGALRPDDHVQARGRDRRRAGSGLGTGTGGGETG